MVVTAKRPRVACDGMATDIMNLVGGGGVRNCGYGNIIIHIAFGMSLQFTH